MPRARLFVSGSRLPPAFREYPSIQVIIETMKQTTLRIAASIDLRITPDTPLRVMEKTGRPITSQKVAGYARVIELPVPVRVAF